MPKPNRNDCKNNGEQTNLLRIQGARSAVYKNLKWAIREKNPNKGGGGVLLARYLIAIIH